MDIISIFLFFISAASFLIPIITLFRRINSSTISFSLLSIANSLWILGIALFRIETDLKSARIWAAMIYLPGGVGLVSLYYFSEIFPGIKKKLSFLKKLFIFLPFPFLVYTLIFTNTFIKNIDLTVKNNSVALGFSYVVWMIYLSSLIILAIYNLITRQSSVSGNNRLQIKLILFSFLIPGIFNLPFNLILPYLGNYNLIWIGPVSYLFLISTIFYAIIRYRLLDIRFAIRAFLVKLIAFFILALLFVGFLLIYRELFGIITPKNSAILTISLSLLGVIIYQPILTFIRNSTDRVFFQREYSQEELLKSLARTIVESIDINLLIENIKEALLQVMRMNFVAFVFFPEKEDTSGKFDIQSFGTFNKNYDFYYDATLVREMVNRQDVIVKDEIRRKSEEVEGEEKNRLKRICDEMDKLDAQVLVPLPGSGGTEGMIILGEKAGNSAYTTTDIQILETLMYQAGTAIENARLYSEVKTFSLKLQKEVKRATTDLLDKNKFLNTLRRLDQIIMNTLGLTPMCQKIVDTVSWEMGYTGGFIALMDDKNNLLRAQAISDTPIFRRIHSLLPKNLNDLAISLNDEHHPLVQAVRDSEMKVIPRMSSIYAPIIDTKAAEEIQKFTHIKCNLIFPLSAKGKKLGVIIIGMNKDFQEVTERERELIQAFVDQAGIAIENASLYSELKIINEELTNANVHLKELDKMKDEFVSIASHELRTPMTAIKGYLWMLTSGRHKLKLRGRHAEYLERVKASTERLINLVSDMLDVSRIEGGRLQINMKSAVMEHLISGVLAELMPKALEKNLTLYFEKPVKPLPKVHMDEERIREVITNLIGNAVKFTPEGGKITLSAKKQGKMIFVSVTDSGRGIAQKDIPKLFQKFGRLEHSFALISETAGTGLGLYITKSLVELHGGKIWVVSKVGKGATFTFSLRLASDEDQASVPTVIAPPTTFLP